MRGSTSGKPLGVADTGERVTLGVCDWLAVCEAVARWLNVPERVCVCELVWACDGVRVGVIEREGDCVCDGVRACVWLRVSVCVGERDCDCEGVRVCDDVCDWVCVGVGEQLIFVIDTVRAPYCACTLHVVPLSVVASAA
jgi:hypothetical protein